MNKFVRAKSHTGSKFSIFLEQLFSLWRQLAPQQSAKFRTACFGQFRASLRKDSVANYASILALFSVLVRGPDVLRNALNILEFRR